MAGKSLVRAALLGTVAVLWLLPTPVGAGGFTIIELGDQKTGMMTGIAKPDDLSAVYHNPAGLADQHGTKLHLSAGFSFVDASVRLKAWEGSETYISTPVDADGYFQGTVHPTRYFGAMPMFVASSDFGWKDGPVVAFSVYVPDFIGAFLPDDAPTRYMVTEAYFIAGVTSVSAGYRLPKPLDLLCLGASVGAMYVRQEGKKWMTRSASRTTNTSSTWPARTGNPSGTWASAWMPCRSWPSGCRSSVRRTSP